MGASFAVAQKLDTQVAIADCAATLQHLGEHDGIGGNVGVIGFCLGGSLAWGVAAAAEPGACVSYYGSQVPAMLDLVDDVTCPTLLHFGREDPYLPMEGVDAIAAATSGKDNVTINVEIAGHAFDNHSSEIFYVESAAKAAWAKTVAFLQTHLPAG
jgi:carboxymethylenebutenolidase